MIFYAFEWTNNFFCSLWSENLQIIEFNLLRKWLSAWIAKFLPRPPTNHPKVTLTENWVETLINCFQVLSKHNKKCFLRFDHNKWTRKDRRLSHRGKKWVLLLSSIFLSLSSSGIRNGTKSNDYAVKMQHHDEDEIELSHKAMFTLLILLLRRRTLPKLSFDDRR